MEHVDSKSWFAAITLHIISMNELCADMFTLSIKFFVMLSYKSFNRIYKTCMIKTKFNLVSLISLCLSGECFLEMNNKSSWWLTSFGNMKENVNVKSSYIFLIYPLAYLGSSVGIHVDCLSVDHWSESTRSSNFPIWMYLVDSFIYCVYWSVTEIFGCTNCSLFVLTFIDISCTWLLLVQIVFRCLDFYWGVVLRIFVHEIFSLLYNVFCKTNRYAFGRSY